MTIKKMVCMLMLAITGTTFGMEENSHPSQPEKKTTMIDLAKKAMIGSIAGSIEVIPGAPASYLTNMKQQGIKPSSNVLEWWRGGETQVAVMGPTTMVQIFADAGLEAVIPGSDAMSKVGRAFSAGAISACVNGPVELVIIDQQKNNGNALNTAKKLIATSGKGVLMRGWVPTALREGGFTTGYLVAYPMLAAAVNNNVDNAAAQFMLNLGAGAVTGAVVATATQPVAVIKTRMQADYKKEVIENMRDAVKTIYAENGAKGLFLGLVPRATRAAVAIPLIGTIKQQLTKYIDEQN